MADTITVKPQEQAPVVVGGGGSATPIKVTTDIDYEVVNKLIDDKVGDIDFSAVAKEQTLLDKAEEIKQAVDNIKLPEIDTTELAKQGENAEATNSKILEEIQAMYDKMTSNMTYDEAKGKLTIKGIIIK